MVLQIPLSDVFEEAWIIPMKMHDPFSLSRQQFDFIGKASSDALK